LTISFSIFDAGGKLTVGVTAIVELRNIDCRLLAVGETIGEGFS